MCVDDKSSELFKRHLVKDAVYNFNNSMNRKSKYCNEVIKKHSNQELLMTNKTMKILRTLLNDRSVIMIILILILK